jgi:predicted nucleic acid-binding protein
VPHSSHQQWHRFFGSPTYWDITRAAATRAGEYRCACARKGQILSTADALIAAVAFESQATLVRRNVKDFPIDDVQLLDII